MAFPTFGKRLSTSTILKLTFLPCILGQVAVKKVDCNFENEVVIQVQDDNDWFSSWLNEGANRSFRGIMGDGTCSSEVDNFITVAYSEETQYYHVTFDAFRCDGDKTSVEDYTKRNETLVIQRLQDHPFMAEERVRQGSVSLKFSCIVDPMEELQLTIGTIEDAVDPIGDDEFETGFQLVQTDAEDGAPVEEDQPYNVNDELFFKASGTVVPGLVYMPIAVTVEKEGCTEAACKWTFFDVGDGIGDGESCSFPGLDFELTKIGDDYSVNYRAFTLQDQDGDGSEYKYVIKIKMQYCIADTEEDTMCKRVQQICGITP